GGGGGEGVELGGVGGVGDRLHGGPLGGMRAAVARVRGQGVAAGGVVELRQLVRAVHDLPQRVGRVGAGGAGLLGQEVVDLLRVRRVGEVQDRAVRRGLGPGVHRYRLEVVQRVGGGPDRIDRLCLVWAHSGVVVR